MLTTGFSTLVIGRMTIRTNRAGGTGSGAACVATAGLRATPAAGPAFSASMLISLVTPLDLSGGTGKDETSKRIVTVDRGALQACS
jgi:hypothetical protein